MLVREQPATELTVATRILARAGALAEDARITLRLHDVVYVGGRDAAPASLTPYDVAVVLAADGSTLHGTPPADIAAYVSAHHATPTAASVVRAPGPTYVTAPTLRACVVAALRRARGQDESPDEATIERVWLDLVAQARISGALIGAFPTEDGTA